MSSMKLSVDRERAAAAIREFLLAVGEDPDREGLRDTPMRVAQAAEELFGGLSQDPGELLATTFDISHDEMVLVRDIRHRTRPTRSDTAYTMADVDAGAMYLRVANNLKRPARAPDSAIHAVCRA